MFALYLIIGLAADACLLYGGSDGKYSSISAALGGVLVGVLAGIAGRR